MHDFIWFHNKLNTTCFAIPAGSQVYITACPPPPPHTRPTFPQSLEGNPKVSRPGLFLVIQRGLLETCEPLHSYREKGPEIGVAGIISGGFGAILTNLKLVTSRETKLTNVVVVNGRGGCLDSVGWDFSKVTNYAHCVLKQKVTRYYPLICQPPLPRPPLITHCMNNRDGRSVHRVSYPACGGLA